MAELALVTGGATGIGKAIVEALAAEGFEVRSASRRSGFDLTDPGAVTRLIESLPRLDVLVNNAGVAESAPVGKTSEALWDAHFALNTRAPFLLVRAALPLLRASPRGCVVNLASTAALRGAPYIAAYTASKHALLGLSRALAAEHPELRVHALCPGFVDSPLLARSVARITELTGRSASEARASLAAQNARGELLDPAEVASAVVDLVSREDSGAEIVLE